MSNYSNTVIKMLRTVFKNENKIEGKLLMTKISLFHEKHLLVYWKTLFSEQHEVY